MAERTEHKNTLMATMLAGVAGVAAGVLFAPKSGRETRAAMRGKATDLKDRASESLPMGKSDE
jgi:gas vesicle protein